MSDERRDIDSVLGEICALPAVWKGNFSQEDLTRLAAEYGVDEASLARGLEALRFLGASTPSKTAMPADREEGIEEGGAISNLPGYHDLQVIGRGGVGVILRATADAMDRPVAIKMLASASPRPSLRERFLFEAKVLGNLEHPGIVPIHEVGRTADGRDFFSMKLVRGKTLAEILSVEPRPRLFAIFLKVCETIAFAHSRGVIHRDLKPSNVMVGEFGEVLVIDWGLAKVLSDPQRHPGLSTRAIRLADLKPEGGLTIGGAVQGTPAYMSPEQARGDLDAVDHRSDVYSLGAILYEIATGTPPFRDGSLSDLLCRVAAGALEPPARRAPDREISRELEAIILGAMSVDPGARYSDATLLQADVQSLLEGRSVSAIEDSLPTLVMKWVRRNRAVSALAGASLMLSLASLVALAVAFLQKREEVERRTLAETESRAKADALVIALAQEEERNRRDAAYARANRLLFEAGAGSRFFPVGEWRSPDYEAWNREASELLETRTLHEAQRSRLEALPARGEADEAALGMEKAILAALEELATARWHQLAERIATASAATAEGWREAVRSIREGYGGLELETVPGLVPLGKDPASGLWEFEHVATAEGIPSPGTCRPMTAPRGVVFVLVPPGRFRMGSDAPEESERQDENPSHEVSVRSFFLSKYEMTQAQWRRLTGEEPSFYQGEPMRPVESVSWEEARSTLFRLGLRLPSESEWEYASRAGTKSEWWTGEDPLELRTAGNVADQSGAKMGLAKGEPWDDGQGPPCPVGLYRANPFGLFDTIGNVREWCEDTYQMNHLGAPVDGSAWVIEGTWFRVVRGGSYRDVAGASRSAFRVRHPPSFRGKLVGFRPVLSIEK